MAKTDIRTVEELKGLLTADRLYTRQETATIVGCIWANVLDASRGEAPKLRGKLILKGTVATWQFTGQDIVNWRAAVETRTSSGLKAVIVVADAEELAELRKLLAGSKFAGRF